VNQTPVRCVIMRGGTSKGVFFHEDDLPADPQARDRALLSIMGSPDPRQIDGLDARRIGGPPPRLHEAFAATGAACTAIAAHIPGTVVHEVSRHDGDGIVRIGHPTGVFPVRVAISADGSIQEASYSRTARRIMDGTVYVRRAVLA